MVRKVIASGQYSISDFNDAPAVSGYIESNLTLTQVYNPNTNLFSPDYEKTPLVLTPAIFVSALGSQNVITNSNIENITWWDGSEQIVNGTHYILEPFQKGKNRILTINKNLLSNEKQSKTFQVKIFYRDMSSNQIVPIIASITIAQISNGSSSAVAQIVTPLGNIFKNDNSNVLTAEASLQKYDGLASTDIAYKWERLNNGKYESITAANANGILGYDSRVLSIPSSSIDSLESFKVSITDNNPQSTTKNQTFVAYTTIVDQTDPIQIQIISTSGNILKNKLGETTLIARVFRKGEEVDTQGNAYVYEWTKSDKEGNLVTGYNKNGKSLPVLASEIDARAIFDITIKESNKEVASGQITIANVDDGKKGDKGSDGIGILNVIEYYLISNSNVAPSVTDTKWTTSIQTMTAELPYLWNYEEIVFSEGPSRKTEPTIMGVYGTKGDVGRSVVSILEYYLISENNTGVTRSTSGWSNVVKQTTPEKKYLWNYEKITWSSSPTGTYVEPFVIGVHGNKGDAAVNYKLQLSNTSLIRERSNWTVKPDHLTIKLVKRIGAEEPIENQGYYQIYEQPMVPVTLSEYQALVTQGKILDPKTFTETDIIYPHILTYESSQMENNIIYRPTNNAWSIQINAYQNSTKETQLDSITVPIIENGMDEELAEGILNANTNINNLRQNLDDKKDIRLGMKLGYSSFSTKNPNYIYFSGTRIDEKTFREILVDSNGSIYDRTERISYLIPKQNINLTGIQIGTRGYIVWDNVTKAIWFIHYEKVMTTETISSEMWKKRNVGNPNDNTEIVLNESMFIIGEIEI